MGRPVHVPTSEMRRTVETLAVVGIPQKEIAAIQGIAYLTLRKHYRVELGDRYCRHTAPRRDGSPDDGRWLFRWPNLAMNIYGDSMNVEVIVPTGPESCTVTYNHLFVDPDAADVAEVIALADTVMDQDRRMVELVQRNLAAGSYRGGRLSPRHENGLAQFQHLVRTATEA